MEPAVGQGREGDHRLEHPSNGRDPEVARRADDPRARRTRGRGSREARCPGPTKPLSGSHTPSSIWSSSTGRTTTSTGTGWPCGDASSSSTGPPATPTPSLGTSRPSRPSTIDVRLYAMRMRCRSQAEARMQLVISTEPTPRGTQACRPVDESKRPPCDACGEPMEPEHAHHRCPSCGYILPCCGW